MLVTEIRFIPNPTGIGKPLDMAGFDAVIVHYHLFKNGKMVWEKLYAVPENVYNKPVWITPVPNVDADALLIYTEDIDQVGHRVEVWGPMGLLAKQYLQSVQALWKMPGYKEGMNYAEYWVPLRVHIHPALGTAPGALVAGGLTYAFTRKGDLSLIAALAGGAFGFSLTKEEY
jgi:hypothetical protein